MVRSKTPLENSSNIISGSKRLIKIPILGLVDAGNATTLVDESNANDFIVVDKKILEGKRKVFGLEIQGESMNKQVMNGIPLKSGNYVIVSKETENIRNGDVVVALLDEGATVKKFVKSKGEILLSPNSSSRQYKPLNLNQFQNAYIAGKVITALNNPKIESTF